MRRALLLLAALVLGAPAAAPAQALDAPASMAVVEAYTRYELLAPGSGKFRILYEVTQTEPGAAWFFNPIRKGSVATDERVTDMATGKPLPFQVVGGEQARKDGYAEADPTYDYIRVRLARPVPKDGGEGRILIDKTYADPKSYFTNGAEIVFSRSLGVKRNAVVLPKGYRLASSNYPSQVLTTPDGRVMISFWNATPAEAPLVIRARPALPTEPPPSATDFDERAHQNRTIVYFLKEPETHAFELYHDYTETRAGRAAYVNVVREGSTVANPSGRNLDTGEPLKIEVLKGEAITRAGLEEEDRPKVITPRSEVVVFRYPPLKPGETARLRLSETYTDPGSYTLTRDQLIWKRSLGRAANAVVLPPDWTLTGSSVPAVVSQITDGRTRLDFINPRLDEIAVTIVAARADRE
ncbi:MAG TPA: hypothetical protein VF559_07315 [Caulobacteraceae bacterium]|jgi:hypothetical protein